MCNQISRKTFAVTLSKRIWLDQRPETANTGMLVMCKQERNLKHKFDHLHLFATIWMRWYILMVKSNLHQTRFEPCKVQVQPKCSTSPVKRWPWNYAKSSCLPGALWHGCHLKNHTGKKWLGGRVFSCRLDTFAQGFEVHRAQAGTWQWTNLRRSPPACRIDMLVA